MKKSMLLLTVISIGVGYLETSIAGANVLGGIFNLAATANNALHSCSSFSPLDTGCAPANGDNQCVGFLNASEKSKSLIFNFKDTTGDTYQLTRTMDAAANTGPNGSFVTKFTSVGSALEYVQYADASKACFSWDSKKYTYTGVNGSDVITGTNCNGPGGPKVGYYGAFWMTSAWCVKEGTVEAL